MSEIADLFGDWMTDEITLRVNTGEGAYGPAYAPGVTVEGVMVGRQRKLIRDSTGNQSVSMLQIMIEPDRAAQFVKGSIVVLGNGDETAVLSIADDSHELPVAVILCE